LILQKKSSVARDEIRAGTDGMASFILNDDQGIIQGRENG
jgi:hypothetical protein